MSPPWARWSGIVGSTYLGREHIVRSYPPTSARTKRVEKTLPNFPPGTIGEGGGPVVRMAHLLTKVHLKISAYAVGCVRHLY